MGESSASLGLSARHLGLPLSLAVAGSFNVLLGLAAWAAARRFPLAAPSGESSRGAEASGNTVTYSRLDSRVAFATAGICGFATMGLEVAWVRFWSLVLGTGGTSRKSNEVRRNASASEFIWLF